MMKKFYLNADSVAYVLIAGYFAAIGAIAFIVS